MPGTGEMLRAASRALDRIRSAASLIHCITSPIAINDCANTVLALGARPIMAEHPKEVRGITALAKGLSVTFANITDARAQSLILSGKEAREREIPSVIDAVGVNCSEYRMDLCDRFLRECRPALVKGNASELRALFGIEHGVSGIDTAEKDAVRLSESAALGTLIEAMKAFSDRTGSAVLVSGAVDLLTDGTEVWAVENGVPELGLVTGTGCMLSCIAAAALSAFPEAGKKEGRNAAMKAGILSVLIMGISGELAAGAVRKRNSLPSSARLPLGAFHTALIDAFSLLTADEVETRARIRRLS